MLADGPTNEVLAVVIWQMWDQGYVEAVGAIGTLLMRFDKEGERLSSFRTYLPYGARMEASQVLVEPSRLLIGADPQGIYEFPKPEKIPR